MKNPDSEQRLPLIDSAGRHFTYVDGYGFLPSIFGGQEGDEGDEGGIDDQFPFGSVPNPARTLRSKEILTRGRELAISGVPLQLSMLLKSLSTLRARASGSTAELFPAITQQLGELRSQYSAASQALARRLGAAGGGQVTRGRQKLLGQASRQFGNILGRAQQEGFAGFLNLQGGFQPFLSGAARPPNVATSPSSFNPAFAGKGIAGLISLAQQFTLNNDARFAQQTIAGFRNNPDFTVGLPSNTTVNLPPEAFNTLDF